MKTYYINTMLKPKTIQAESKVKALKLAGVKKIYFSGSKPYGIDTGITTKRIYATIQKPKT
jgi:hypothetical protein